ncbi:hypothetical protein OROMI_009826 [Orobanche minor]
MSYLRKLGNLDESTAHIESIVTSPIRIPISVQDQSHNKVPSLVRDPSPNRVPIPEQDSSPIQASIPVEDPIHTVNQIPVRSPSQVTPTFDELVEQAFQRFIKWKSFRIAPYDILFNWQEWKEEELFILNVTGTLDIQLLIKWEDQRCQDLIRTHYLAQDATRLTEQGKSADETPKEVVLEENLLQDQNVTGTQEEVIPHVQIDDIPVCSSNPNQDNVSRDIPHEESVPMLNQANAARQQLVEHPATPSSSTATPSSSKHPQLEKLETISRQTIFLTDAVNALYNVSKEMDWLNLAATEEMSSVKSELTKIAQAFSVLPQDMKKAISDFQQIQEQSLLEEQSKIRISESKIVAILEYTDSRISGHDRKIEDMTNFINSLAEKLSRFEEQQENVLKVLHSIDHTVSRLNARKGENDQRNDQDNQDADS